MTSLSDKVVGILPILEREGEVYLFALAEREDIDRWDVVLSADWADDHWEKAVRLVVDLLEPRLDSRERALISRIAVIPSHDPNVQSLPMSLDGIVPADNKRISIELLGSDIRSAFIFKSKRPPLVSTRATGNIVEMVNA